MAKNLSLLIFVMFVSFSNSRSLEIRSNFDVIDSLSKKAATEIILRLDHNKTDSLFINFAQNPAWWLIEQHLLSIGKSSGKYFFTQDQINLSILSVNIKKMNVEYYIHRDDDSLSRKITLIINNTLETSNGALSGLPEITIEWNDNISRNDLSYIESSPYPFTKGQIPEPEQTFFEKIAEPVIFISTAIITIALLFSVRS